MNFNDYFFGRYKLWVVYWIFGQVGSLLIFIGTELTKSTLLRWFFIIYLVIWCFAAYNSAKRYEGRKVWRVLTYLAVAGSAFITLISIIALVEPLVQQAKQDQVEKPVVRQEKLAQAEKPVFTDKENSQAKKDLELGMELLRATVSSRSNHEPMPLIPLQPLTENSYEVDRFDSLNIIPKNSFKEAISDMLLGQNPRIPLKPGVRLAGMPIHDAKALVSWLKKDKKRVLIFLSENENYEEIIDLVKTYKLEN